MQYFLNTTENGDDKHIVYINQGWYCDWTSIETELEVSIVSIKIDVESWMLQQFLGCCGNFLDVAAIVNEIDTEASWDYCNRVCSQTLTTKYQDSAALLHWKANPNIFYLPWAWVTSNAEVILKTSILFLKPSKAGQSV